MKQLMCYLIICLFICNNIVDSETDGKATIEHLMNYRVDVAQAEAFIYQKLISESFNTNNDKSFLK